MYHCEFALDNFDLLPGTTEAQRMSKALQAVLTVSKTDLLKKEAQVKRANTNKKRTKRH